MAAAAPGPPGPPGKQGIQGPSGGIVRVQGNAGSSGAAGAAGATGPAGAPGAVLITRAQIATWATLLPTTFLVSGFSIPGDLGAGAIYTSQGATSGGPMAVQTADGTWYQLVLYGAVSAGWFGAAGNGSADDTVAFQAAVNASKYVAVSGNENLKLTSTVSIPSGVILRIEGTISGTGVLNFAGDCQICGTGSVAIHSGSHAIQVVSGSIVILDIIIDVGSGTHAILIAPTAPISSLRIIGIHIKSAAYGILRNGGTSFATTGVVISNNIIENCNGDGIEWNQGPVDLRIEVCNNIIYNSYGSGANQGIGIGIAGLGPYVTGEPTTSAVNDVIISGNVVDTAGEGIHCEIVEHLLISDNQIRNVAAANGGSGITGSGIIVYAVWQASITGNQIWDAPAYGIYVGMGVNAAVYTGSSHEVKISNNQIRGATSHGLIVSVSALASGEVQPNFPNVYINDNNLTLANDIFYRGATNLYMENNNVLTALAGTQYTIDFFSSTYGALYTQTASGYKFFAKVVNNTGIDAAMASNVSIINLSPPAGSTFTLQSSNNSFSLGVVYTIANLPSGLAQGTRLLVSNGVASPVLGAIPSTTGAQIDSVYFDGTNWRYG